MDARQRAVSIVGLILGICACVSAWTLMGLPIVQRQVLLYDLGADLSEPSLAYQQKIDDLNAIENTLDNLKEFIDKEKDNLRETELTLERLKEEQERLQPIVETDRDTVEAILTIQQERERKDIWVDRAFAYVLGVLSSITVLLIVGSYNTFKSYFQSLFSKSD